MGVEKQQDAQNLNLYEWVRSLVCVVVSLLLVFTFLVRIVRVDGASMRETLQDGDLLVVLSAMLCGDAYAAGDIVIVQKDSFNSGEPIVKRVIATAGQTVDMDFTSGIVWVDGAALAEPYVREPTYTAEGMDFPLTVPEGCLFLMGDNRNRSDDSRNPELDAVDTRSVSGRALLLAFPGKTVELGRREWSRIGILN